MERWLRRFETAVAEASEIGVDCAAILRAPCACAGGAGGPSFSVSPMTSILGR